MPPCYRAFFVRHSSEVSGDEPATRAAIQHGHSAATLRSARAGVRLPHRDHPPVPDQPAAVAETGRVLHHVLQSGELQWN